MDAKKIAVSVVSIAIACLFAVTLLIPVIADSTAETDTFTNKGVFYVEVDPTDTYTIEYDKATELGVVYINDEPMDVPFSTGYTIMAIDDAILRLQSGDNTIQYKGGGYYITGILKLDLTVSGGSITGTFQTGTSGGVDSAWPTTTYTECHIASPDKQDYTMTAYNTVTKMNGDSEIFAFGQTQLTGTTTLVLVKIEGTIEDSVEISVLDKTTGAEIEGAEITNLSINATEDSEYIDLYDLSSITFTITLADESTTNATYSAYIVPTEVTAERSIHPDANTNALLNLIPLLVVVGIILGTVGIIALRK